MNRITVYLILLLAGIALLVIFPNNSIAVSLAVTLMGIILTDLVNQIHEDKFPLTLYYYSLRYWNKDIRISVSYLYRIISDNHFLLVKSPRYRHFQPVGGVYKLNARGKESLDSIGWKTDPYIRTDDDSRDDLRIIIKGRRILKLIKWINQGKGREVDHWREFYNELIVPEILPHSIFPWISSEFRGRLINKMRFSEHAQMHEILIFDIFDLICNNQQEDHLREMKNANTSTRLEQPADFLWATDETIHRRGDEAESATRDIRIASHAAWINDFCAKVSN